MYHYSLDEFEMTTKNKSIQLFLNVNYLLTLCVYKKKRLMNIQLVIIFSAVKVATCK